MEETRISRVFRDSRLLSIGGGADEVMLGIIAKSRGHPAGQEEAREEQRRLVEDASCFASAPLRASTATT